MQEYILSRLEAHCYGEHTINIYGGAYHFARDYNSPLDNLDEFLCYVSGAIESARFYDQTTKPSTVVKNYCNLFRLDPALLECAIGYRLFALDIMAS